MYSSVGYYSKFGSILSLEKMTSFSQSEKDVEMATVTSCCLIPLWIKCDRRLVDLMFPGQRALGPMGDCPGRTYLWLTAIFPSTSPPTKPYPCAPTSSDSPRPDPSSLLSHRFLPTFLRLSIDMFFFWIFFLFLFHLPSASAVWHLEKKRRLILSEGWVLGKASSAKQRKETGTVMKQPTLFLQRLPLAEGAAYCYFLIINISWHLLSMNSAPSPEALYIYSLFY